MSSHSSIDDALIERPAPTPIPVLSPTLHCVSMTAFVYLRTSFGYTFLRPKSIFIAFSWAFMLAVIIAWNEPPIWREYRAVWIFGTGAVILYCYHLWIAFSREWRKRGEDDPYPGASNTERLARLFGFPNVAEETLRFWVEPGIVAFISLVLRFPFGETHLSAWLLFVAFCMVGREAINHWTTVRRDKAFFKGVEKAKKQGESLSAEYQNPQPVPKPVRKKSVEKKRNFAALETTEAEKRFAEILRLLPPYTLEKAEENFIALIKLEHPDATSQSPEHNARAAELNEAIQFFRTRLGGGSSLLRRDPDPDRMQR